MLARRQQVSIVPFLCVPGSDRHDQRGIGVLALIDQDDPRYPRQQHRQSLGNALIRDLQGDPYRSLLRLIAFGQAAGLSPMVSAKERTSSPRLTLSETTAPMLAGPRSRINCWSGRIG